MKAAKGDGAAEIAATTAAVTTRRANTSTSTAKATARSNVSGRRTRLQRRNQMQRLPLAKQGRLSWRPLHYSVLLPAMEMAARATAQIPHLAARLLRGPLMPNRNCPTGQTRLPLALLELPLRPYLRLRVQVASCGPILCKQIGAGGKERSFTHVAQIGSFVIADPVCKRQAPCLAELCPTLLSDRLPIAI
jgi:hypothetical protein